MNGADVINGDNRASATGLKLSVVRVVHLNQLNTAAARILFFKSLQSFFLIPNIMFPPHIQIPGKNHCRNLWQWSMPFLAPCGHFQP